MRHRAWVRMALFSILLGSLTACTAQSQTFGHVKNRPPSLPPRAPLDMAKSYHSSIVRFVISALRPMAEISPQICEAAKLWYRHQPIDIEERLSVHPQIPIVCERLGDHTDLAT